MKKTLIVALMLWVVMLFPGCKNSTTPDIPDPCKPEIDEVFEVKVVIDYYRLKAENPGAPDLAYIVGSFTNYWTEPMIKVGKDHFQYTCTLRANSNPKTLENAYYVAISDPKREFEGSRADELITVNGVELTRKIYATNFAWKVFWLDKCKVITE